MTTLDISNFPAVRVVQAGEGGRSWSDRALVDTDTNNWAPRIGFAFQPASKWAVRAASGMFYGTPKAQAANLRLINNWPHYRDVLKRSTPTESAGQLASGIDASLLGGATEMPDDLNWNVWAKDFKLPTIYQWNLERPAADRPFHSSDGGLRRLIVEPSSALVQHQRRGSRRSENRAPAAADSLPGRHHVSGDVRPRKL